ncbi:MAG: hypothetical protein JWP06_456 [Candidatus Saccharibacteria bacterium]|nr:hypothetical protein [Candidatus Saccharibacteria bacterium]
MHRDSKSEDLHRFDEVADLDAHIDHDVVEIGRDHQVTQVLSLVNDRLQRSLNAKELARVHEAATRDREADLPADPADLVATCQRKPHAQLIRCVDPTFERVHGRYG